MDSVRKKITFQIWFTRGAEGSIEDVFVAKRSEPLTTNKHLSMD